MVRLIVIENDPLLRRALVAVLKQDGNQVLAAAENGVDALDAISEAHPDLILTDQDMPGGSGLELVQRLRSAGDQTPVIMLSGQSDPSTIAHATAVGVNRYLIKPVTADLLTLAIRQTHRAAAA